MHGIRTETKREGRTKNKRGKLNKCLVLKRVEHVQNRLRGYKFRENTVTITLQNLEFTNCKKEYNHILRTQAGRPHIQQLMRLRFGIWKRWCRTTCEHFGVRVLLQWRSRTFGRLVRRSNLPPYCLRFWKMDSLLKASRTNA